ncbi:MAG: RNA polymerase sigma factor [Ignavibacteriales bacterium]|nr:RNA polymerase sigma factor [Ignavibacteriales bacterium]
MITEEKIAVLVKEIQRNNQDCFKEFFFIMQPIVFSFILKYTSNRESAEDLTQETFIRFWASRDKLDYNSSPKGYLFKIARNLSLNYLVREKKPLKIPNEDDYLILLSQNREDELRRVFFHDDCQKAINMLPERCRATFLLSRYGGFNYYEIAEIMDVSLQTVKNQMNKAISVLKKLLSYHID